MLVEPTLRNPLYWAPTQTCDLVRVDTEGGVIYDIIAIVLVMFLQIVLKIEVQWTLYKERTAVIKPKQKVFRCINC